MCWHNRTIGWVTCWPKVRSKPFDGSLWRACLTFIHQTLTAPFQSHLVLQFLRRRYRKVERLRLPAWLRSQPMHGTNSSHGITMQSSASVKTLHSTEHEELSLDSFLFEVFQDTKRGKTHVPQASYIEAMWKGFGASRCRRRSPSRQRWYATSWMFSPIWTSLSAVW